MESFDDIKKIRDFKSLVKYLRTHLDWPVDEDEVDDLTFDYDAKELGLSDKAAVKIRQIKQLRPLADHQPWGIFWIDFEPKRLPVVVMRRVLGALVMKQRGSRDDRQAAWNLSDLMFISATGEGQDRGISFAHFQDMPDGLPQLRTFSWDANENHFYYLEKVNLECLRWPGDPKNSAAWREDWSSAFTTAHREVITSSQVLASRMAKLAAATRSLVNDVFAAEQPEGPLHVLYASFKRVLIHDLSVDDFADMYAQTVTYGLFSAYATNPHSGELSLEQIDQLIPPTNPFLRELFAECVRVGAAEAAEMDLDELGVGELMALLRQANMTAILQDFGRQTRGEDPVIHFYESFLREYDAQKKAQRGVFYTPDPVVSFIVRSVDYLLKTELGCPDGLADTGTMEWKGQQVPRVQVLDPATGTGTFLKYVIEQIYATFYQKTRNISAAERDKRWNEYVPKYLLPRLFGFELMMAPYAVAHLKLGLVLREKGYKFGSDERLRVYLTNTLQSVNEIPRTDSPLLAHEAEQANEVKARSPIFIVIGNPPYSYVSENNGEFISHLVRDYYQVDGTPLRERNPRGLQDDYVKFIRFGQWRIDQTGEGILSMITNHGYIDNPTFRGMRQKLMQSFDEIYILDLHGNGKRKTNLADDGEDENVFDIQQGVAICFMVKRSNNHNPCQVFRSDLVGTRKDKYNFLLTNSAHSTEWTKINPQPPFYLFIDQDVSFEEEYERNSFKLVDIFPKNSVGISTSRDSLTVQIAESEMMKVINDFSQLDIEDARIKFSLGDDSLDWLISLAQDDLKNSGLDPSRICPIMYRPFDIRYTYYTGRSRGFHSRPRPEVMDHLYKKENIALLSNRQVNDEFRHAFVTRYIADGNSVSLATRERTYIFPLYIEEDKMPSGQMNAFVHGVETHRPNIDFKIARRLGSDLGFEFISEGKGDLKSSFGPEDIFGYIYAILYSPSFRSRYIEYLKMDFPRMPFTKNQDLFNSLVKKGASLVDLHLLEKDMSKVKLPEFIGWADNSIASGYPNYLDGKVWINPQQGFENVTEEVWDFYIGGYQVCHKWLKDRRGRQLNQEDIEHYQKIIVVIQETIRLMGEIDEVIEEHGGWPLK